MTIEELKQLKRWVCWKLTTLPGKEKPTKVPYMPSGRKAESDDPATWSTYAERLAAKNATPAPDFCRVAHHTSPLFTQC